MKKVIYENLYKLLSFISKRINNQHVNQYKIAIGTSLLLFSSGSCYAQKRVNNDDTLPKDSTITNNSNKETDSIDDSIFCYVVEVMPEFPGGSLELMKFISTNLYYPKECDHIEEIHGRIIIQFKVLEDGSISNPKVIRGIHPKLDEAAIEVINKMPKWKPGMMHGKPIATSYTIPILIRTK